MPLASFVTGAGGCIAGSTGAVATSRTRMTGRGDDDGVVEIDADGRFLLKKAEIESFMVARWLATGFQVVVSLISVDARS